MVLCLGEPPRRFLWCLVVVLHFIFVSSFHFWSSFVDVLHFVVVSSFTFTFWHHRSPYLWTIARFLHTFHTFSPAHCRVICDTFIFNFSVIFLPRALRFWMGIFYPQAFFTLCSFSNIFDSTCIYQGLPRSRQFFLEVCRALYWSSKHRPSPSVCLIHSNPQIYIQNDSVLNSTIC